MQSSTQIQVSDKRKETGDWSIFDLSSYVKEEKQLIYNKNMLRM